jgi:hypothetical protein
VLDGLAKAGKHAMAGRPMAYARACYGWAMKRDRVTNNPFQGLPIPAAVTSRDRVLSDDEAHRANEGETFPPRKITLAGIGERSRGHAIQDRQTN